MNLKNIIAVTVLFGASTSASAGGYFGAELYNSEIEFENIFSVEPKTMMVTLGSNINENMAIEGKLGLGILDDSISESGDSVSFKVENSIGAYVKGLAPLNESVKLYGLIGISRVSIEVSVDSSSFGVSGSESMDETGLTYGFGMLVRVGQSAGLAIEYKSLFDGDMEEIDTSVTGFSIGYQSTF